MPGGDLLDAVEGSHNKKKYLQEPGFFRLYDQFPSTKKGRHRQKMAGSWKGIVLGFPQRTLDLCGNVIELSMIFSHGQLAVGTTGALGERRLPSGLRRPGALTGGCLF